MSDTEQIIFSRGDLSQPPDLRFIHYNDVYHVDASSAEPVGGIARFQTLVNHYRDDEKFEEQPNLLVLFSGDAFNPSLESTVTKGNHMVPILNDIGTDVACVGNHDLDFGIEQFRHLADQCKFPWLLANVTDPALGEDVPLANAKKSVILESSNNIKIGVFGIVEKEWLATINSLPPNLNFKSAHDTAAEIVPQLREQGADIIIAVSHQREPNDKKLAESIPSGLVDIILGGHDHFYSHSILNKVHILRSGTDFKQLSYVEARRSKDGKNAWEFHIVRRDAVSTIPENSQAKETAEQLTSALKSKLDKPVGHTIAPLDARFETVRLKESNMGNFVCDLMRTHYNADCCIVAAGTIRGDQIYPPGVLRLKDIMNCFPFEDPCVVLRTPGHAILAALENSVFTYPALEGRFPQVSHIHFEFDPSLPPGRRIPNPTSNVKIGGEPLDLKKDYKLVTRDYMARGKDGFDSLLMESEGGELEEIVNSENGILISMLLRQYFMSLKILGQWSKWGHQMDRHWKDIHKNLHKHQPVVQPRPTTSAAVSASKTLGTTNASGSGLLGIRPASFQRTVSGMSERSIRSARSATDAKFIDDSDDEEHTMESDETLSEVRLQERRLHLARQVMNKWRRLAGIKHPPSCENLKEGEFEVNWTHAISPRVEGRIKITGAA